MKPLYEQEGSSYEDLVDWNQLGEQYEEEGSISEF
jgi:hypothetical protein